MSKIVSHFLSADGREIELVKLDRRSDDPWTACIQQAVADGKNYGSPGKRIYVNRTNFRTMREAKDIFEKMRPA